LNQKKIIQASKNKEIGHLIKKLEEILNKNINKKNLALVIQKKKEMR
jgi:hypothetical protein